MIREFARIHGPLAQQLQDLPPRGIGQSLENRIHDSIFGEIQNIVKSAVIMGQSK